MKAPDDRTSRSWSVPRERWMKSAATRSEQTAKRTAHAKKTSPAVLIADGDLFLPSLPTESRVPDCPDDPQLAGPSGVSIPKVASVRRYRKAPCPGAQADEMIRLGGLVPCSRRPNRAPMQALADRAACPVAKSTGYWLPSAGYQLLAPSRAAASVTSATSAAGCGGRRRAGRGLPVCPPR